MLQHNYASTSLSCAGIQQWKSVSFRCWAAINLVGEMSNEEQDTQPPTLPTLFLPHSVKSSTYLLALDEQWAAGHLTPYPTHPFPSSLCEEFYILACSWWAMSSRTPHPLPYPPFSFSLCEEFCMSDNMCISHPPAAVLAYWDPGGLAHFHCYNNIISFILGYNVISIMISVTL